jgi:protein-S-isoprenylcysteine O-methyltransferase Ste14
MPVLALVILVAWLVLVASVRGYLHRRRTGAVPVPPRATRGSPQMWAFAGIAGTLLSQAAMGDAWRPDVTPGDHTDLVTDGPFRIVRNPILACTLATAVGLTLLVPNLLALAMVVCIFVGIQIQVRLVEEPHLIATHGDPYRSYAARTGRFLPMIGRMRGED